MSYFDEQAGGDASDDDKKNVKAAEDFFRHELSVMYPEVRFVIYDTSEGGSKKIVIEKD